MVNQFFLFYALISIQSINTRNDGAPSQLLIILEFLEVLFVSVVCARANIRESEKEKSPRCRSVVGKREPKPF